MSLTPVFEIGLWNAWILMLYFPLHPLLMILIDRLVGMGDIAKKWQLLLIARPRRESAMAFC